MARKCVKKNLIWALAACVAIGYCLYSQPPPPNPATSYNPLTSAVLFGVIYFLMCVPAALISGACENYARKFGNSAYIRVAHALTALFAILILGCITLVGAVSSNLLQLVAERFDVPFSGWGSSLPIFVGAAGLGVCIYLLIAVPVFALTAIITRILADEVPVDNEIASASPSQHASPDGSVKVRKVGSVNRTVVYDDVGLVSGVAGVLAVCGSDGWTLATVCVASGILVLIIIKSLTHHQAN